MSSPAACSKADHARRGKQPVLHRSDPRRARLYHRLVLGGALTRPNLDWYATLQKPGFAPPNGVYAMIALSAWIVWRASGKDSDRELAFIWFFIQLAIGVLWSVAFFAMHSPGLGLVVIMAFLIAIVLSVNILGGNQRCGQGLPLCQEGCRGVPLAGVSHRFCGRRALAASAHQRALDATAARN